MSTAMILLRTSFNVTRCASTRKHCQHETNIKHVWENVSTLNFQGPGNVKNELGLKSGYPMDLCRINISKLLSKGLGHSENDSPQSRDHKKHTKHIETVNTARPCSQKNGWMSTCLLKARLKHDRSAVR